MAASSETPKIKVMFDWGSGVCLCSANEITERQFGDYPVETRQLGLPDALTQAGEDLITRFDESLHWEDPGDPSRWDDAQWTAIETAARTWLALVRDAAPGIDFIDQLGSP